MDTEAIRAGSPRENAGIEEMPLLLRLNVAPAFSFDLVLSDFSEACEAALTNINTRKNAVFLILIMEQL